MRLEAVETRAAVTNDGRWRAEAMAGPIRVEGGEQDTYRAAIDDALDHLAVELRRLDDTVQETPCDT